MAKLLTTLALLATLLVAPAAHGDDEQPPTEQPPAEQVPDDGTPAIEDYAEYVGQKTCRPKPRKGTVLLGLHLLDAYGGGGGASGRACGGGASEHKDGRAIDWTLDATVKADRKLARRFLEDVFATDADGHAHALARRMGIMYIIWNDQMYAAWDRFEPEPYLSSSCRSKKRCSKTLRHRDHVHISLSMPGAKARTSWYEGL
jgi:hypothetical protein